MTPFTPEDALALGSEIAYKTKGRLLTQETYVTFYGRTPDEVWELWETCNHRVTPVRKHKHLLWALMYMKLYLPWSVIAVLVDASVTTVDKWVGQWIHAIAAHHVEVIDWNKRNRNVPKNIWCRVSVDGTDFQIGEPTPFSKKWKSPKFKGAALKYEVAISIYSGDIVWIYGPHLGSRHDLTIFREQLALKLDEGEMVEGDSAYKAVQCRSRDDYLTEAERQEKSEIQARHETVNRRFKIWGVLKQQFRNDKRKHHAVFYAIATMVQMTIDNGNVLFSVEPITRKEAYYHI